jgi:hypothetical protein
MLLALITLIALPLSGCRKGQAGGERRVAGDAGEIDSGPVQATSCDQLTCTDPAQCQLSDGIASCVCPGGYDSDPNNPNGCVDVDECSSGASECDEHASCHNRDGSYDCICNDGFSGTGKVCTALDDCGGVTNTCHADATCTRTDNGVACTCTTGFEGDGHLCTDIDECAAGTAQCAENGHCENLRSSYDCVCDPLFEGDGKTQCRNSCDIAETDATRCDVNGNARCSYAANGGARCTSCLPGYIGDGKTCTASQECAALGCGVNTVCTGSAGQRSCACAPGYGGDPQGGCTDIDECSSGDATCDGATTTCLNTDGGYLCNCKTGLERSGNACVNIDECARGLDLCDSAATCTDTPTGYTCACNSGYSGDGFACQDVDECAMGTDNCVKDGVASCQNTRGSFECVCPKGYAGGSDGDACYCDFAGFWGAREKATLTVPSRTAGNVVIVDQSTTHATVWELYKFVYDGSTLRIESQSCGADNTGEIYSPLYSETYSSSIPNMTYDQLGLTPIVDVSINKSMAQPNMPFSTPHFASLLGLHLDDPINDPWPAAYTDVPESAWIDTDHDGQPGISLWPGQTTQMTHDGSGTYSYLPVELDGDSTRIKTRSGCVSTAVRTINRLDGRIETCGRLTGKIVNEKTEGRVHSCSVVRQSDWDTLDVSCQTSDWNAARLCDDDQIAFLDGQDQTSMAMADFELIKLADLNASNIDCAAVRSMLPATEGP